VNSLFVFAQRITKFDILTQPGQFVTGKEPRASEASEKKTIARGKKSLTLPTNCPNIPMTMFISVDPSDPKPTYLQIVEAVRRAIAIGALRPGDQLPTIREVAVRARINRNTVSRAYLELEHQGLVRARQGAGCFVSNGGTNVARKERLRQLRRKAEELALEAFHYRVPVENVVDMLRESAGELREETVDE
jgi:GntR family transcriptional regulator